MKWRVPGWILGGALALAIPWAALTFAASAEQRALKMIVPPFAWQRLLAAHLLATLPLSLVLAAGVLQLLKKQTGEGSFLSALLEELGQLPGQGKKTAWVWGVLGAILAVVTVLNGAKLAGWLDLQDGGFVAHLAVRFLWCLLLQLPWCLLGGQLADSAWPVHWSGAVLAALFSVAGPLLFTFHLIDTQATQFAELIQRDRLASAHNVAEGLHALGSREPLAGQPMGEMLPNLRSVLAQHALAVRAPLPKSAPLEVRVQRAGVLAKLGRYDEALAQLADAPATDVDAAMLRAAILQAEKRWPESTGEYRRALKLLASSSGDDKLIAAARKRVYSGLAFNAREQRDFAEAEKNYREGLAKLPEHKAYFEFQLGRHYKEVGRPGDAVQHLETAAELDASYRKQAEDLIVGINMNQGTPTCFTRFWGK